MKRSVTATKAPGHVKRDIGTYLVRFLNYGERYLVILVLVLLFFVRCVGIMNGIHLFRVPDHFFEDY